MTLLELHERLEGWKWRDDHRMEQLAWQTAHLINIHLKPGRRIEGEDLLRKKGGVNRNATTPDKTKEELDSLVDELVPPGVKVS